MFLKALEIQGFKSFPDKIKITIEKGITAVVGPNGSGKSNISDAIRWVLGETSARQLRGGGKMENVIFGGTQTRGAMGFAFVRLYIDNTDRRIDVDADEVIIGRKYYRSGESEYTINGQNVRLKDIYEMFLDTGIGRDGYSIISQGRIAEIVGAKSAERREIFEEASGIARFRYRKNEAEKRLDAAEENLVRLRDILGELEQRVGPLQKESEKAQRFVKLSERRKQLEVTLWVDTVRKAREALRDQQRKLEIARADYERVSKEIEQSDAQTEGVRAEIESLNRKAEQLNLEIRTTTQEISGADARLAVLQNNREHNDAAAEQMRAELESMGRSKEQTDAEKQRRLAEREEAQQTLSALREQEHRLTQELQQILESSLASGEKRGALEAQLAGIAQEMTAVKVQQAAQQSAFDAAQTRLAAAGAELEENVRAQARMQEESADTQALWNDAKARKETSANIARGLELKLEAKQKAQEQMRAEETRLRREEESAAQRLSVLQDFEKNLDGFHYSVKSVMKAVHNKRLRGIFGPVSTILTVQSGYEVAVETALGAAMQNIVVEDQQAAKAAMAFLKAERAGRATFLPLDTVRPSHFDASRLPQGAKLACDLVRFQPEFSVVVSNLLGRIVVVQDIDEAARVAKLLDYKNRVVTVDGQVVNAGGSFTGGSVQRSAGLFSRKQEMDELTAKLERMKARREKAAEQTAQAEQEAADLKAQFDSAKERHSTAHTDEIRAEAEMRRVQAGVLQLDQIRQQLESECSALRDKLEQHDRQMQNDAQRKKALEEKTAELEQKLREIAGSDTDFLKQRTALSEELSALKLEVLSKNRDIESIDAALEHLHQQTSQTSQRTEELQAGIARIKEQNEQTAQEMERVRQSVEEGRQKIQQKEQEIAACASERMEKEGQITQQTRKARDLSAEKEALTREAARLEEQKQAKDTEYQQTAAKLWEEYELSLEAAEALCQPFESLGELRMMVAQVRAEIKALGNVNVGAIEEYEQVKERYEFLRVQVSDVEKSKAELLQLIAQLCEEMRDMFSKSFAEINGHFQRIFQLLFGGGSARLYLDDENDVLSSGISIDVTPPGKVIKDLASLSGGEQSLVAIAIYFAILAVNPSPFCVMDEIEAALDDVNVVRYAQYLRRICTQTQFVVITHRRGTMEQADVLYGVTMQEDGVSKVLKLDVAQAEATLV